jgi:hypothetical protein
MKNHLASHINGARRKGVTQGIEFMAGLILLALNNIADEYIEEEKIGQFLIDTEHELNRLYQETLKTVPTGEIDEMAEKIVYHVGEIRKKRNMDGVEDSNSGESGN